MSRQWSIEEGIRTVSPAALSKSTYYPHQITAGDIVSALSIIIIVASTHTIDCILTAYTCFSQAQHVPQS